MYRNQIKHLKYLQTYLQKYQEYVISLDSKKYTFVFILDILLEHIICKEGILVNSTKI